MSVLTFDRLDSDLVNINKSLSQENINVETINLRINKLVDLIKKGIPELTRDQTLAINAKISMILSKEGVLGKSDTIDALRVFKKTIVKKCANQLRANAPQKRDELKRFAEVVTKAANSSHPCGFTAAVATFLELRKSPTLDFSGCSMQELEQFNRLTDQIKRMAVEFDCTPELKRAIGDANAALLKKIEKEYLPLKGQKELIELMQELKAKNFKVSVKELNEKIERIVPTLTKNEVFHICSLLGNNNQALLKAYLAQTKFKFSDEQINEFFGRWLEIIKQSAPRIKNFDYYLTELENKLNFGTTKEIAEAEQALVVFVKKYPLSSISPTLQDRIDEVHVSSKLNDAQLFRKLVKKVDKFVPSALSVQQLEELGRLIRIYPEESQLKIRVEQVMIDLDFPTESLFNQAYGLVAADLINGFKRCPTKTGLPKALGIPQHQKEVIQQLIAEIVELEKEHPEFFN